MYTYHRYGKQKTKKSLDGEKKWEKKDEKDEKIPPISVLRSSTCPASGRRA